MPDVSRYERARERAEQYVANVDVGYASRNPEAAAAVQGSKVIALALLALAEAIRPEPISVKVQATVNEEDVVAAVRRAVGPEGGAS